MSVDNVLSIIGTRSTISIGLMVAVSVVCSGYPDLRAPS